MNNEWKLSPAHMTVPGSGVNRDSVVFSTVFRDCKRCGLILYRLSDLSEHVIEFTDAYRYGSLYSVRIEGIHPQEWAYRYYRDNYSFEDPYARELIELKTAHGPIVAGRLFPSNEDELPAYGNQKPGAWADQLIYVCHVKGLTASRTSKVSHRGTFRGVTEKIPYLQKLGVTALELLPVYELRPEALDRIDDLPDVLRKEDIQSTILRKKKPDEKINYWNFGEGCYFAPKHAYAFSHMPQQEFRDMVDALHKAGIRVYLQLFFPETVSIQTQQEAARFYVTHYHVDGFHLKGVDTALRTLASDPMLSQTALFYYNFPYEELQKEDKENPAAGKPSIHHLVEYRDDFEPLVRKFVKSDNFVLRPFVQRFVSVPEDHGEVHYVCNYDGFTLMDLVSYNWKHNQENGENDADGEDNNNSWNCGFEGKTLKHDVRTLRVRQLKNFLTLNFLAQGTPVLHAGDERCNSQNGNNNPYCQDNETGWTTWTDTVDSREILKFTQQISAFRREHAIFRRRHPFSFNDFRQLGYPDLSFHGKDAYKADFSGYCHTIGIMYNEAYADAADEEGAAAGKEQAVKTVADHAENAVTDRVVKAVAEQTARTVADQADPAAKAVTEPNVTATPAAFSGDVNTPLYHSSQSANRLLYLAINMHWHNQPLGVPQPPKGYHWYMVMDTFQEQSFQEEPVLLADQRHLYIPGRSIQILEALPERIKPVQASVRVIGQSSK